MKLYKGIFLSLTVAAALTGCSKEDPFVDPVYDGPTGQLRTSCLAPSLSNPDGYELTRAAVPSTDDFKVVITRSDARAGSVEYKYSEMPEVLTLPVGDYKVYAHHGDNKAAAWEEPYYYGESSFGIDANKITDDVEPIVAKLANVRVTIVFHPSLVSAMSEDSKVEVKVGAGDGTAMTFSPGETRSAYFRYAEQSKTLAATFSGMVDGSKVVETKTHDNVAPGNHYRITFRMHGINPDNPGTIDGGVTVDASVEKVDMNLTVDGEEEKYEEDDMRPGQDESVTPPNPGPDVPEGPAPEAIALEPEGEFAGLRKLEINAVNDADNLYCAWKVISKAEGGFTKFDVQIISPTLTPGELEGVGLTDKLNLITKGQYDDALLGLGFPVNLGGQEEAKFDITGFLPLMAALGTNGQPYADHEFRLTVADKNGPAVISIKIRTY